METAADNIPIVRFGPFEANLRTGELRKRGIRISLQEQPLRILAALLEAPGDVVTRQELCRRLWPDGTFVDFEHSLNAAVRRLRVTLGDDAAIPRFIETIPRRGYRFLAMNDAFHRPFRAIERSRSSGSATARGRSRLAVMPFSLLAGAPDSLDAAVATLFADGLADEAITQLARACPDHVGVMARTLMLRPDQDRSAGDIGRALGANYLLQGRVRREGTRVRVTAQLIESEEETVIWAATYDRVLSDALTAQMEVAEAITTAVVHALTHQHGTAVGF